MPCSSKLVEREREGRRRIDTQTNKEEEERREEVDELGRVKAALQNLDHKMSNLGLDHQAQQSHQDDSSEGQGCGGGYW